MSFESSRITARCGIKDCVKTEEIEFESFPQARRFAKEHVRHTGHKVIVNRNEYTWFEPGDDDA